MYPISNVFAGYLRRRDREFVVRAAVGGEIYESADIVEFEVENSLTLGEQFEIGTACLSKLTITLRLQGDVPSNARIVPFLALNTAGLTWMDAVFPWEDANIAWEGGPTDWLPLGEFYVDSRERTGDVWKFTCYDKLVWADTPYLSSLSYPTSMQAVWDEICGQLGYSYDSSVVINPAYQLQAGPVGYSMRQVMGYIAAANAASVFAGKDGVLRFKRFSAAAAPVFDMTTADYVRVKETNPVRTFSRVVVTYDTEDKLTYEAGVGDEASTLYVEIPFATQAMTDALHATLDGFSYMPIDMDARGFPQLDQGDVFSFEQYVGHSWEGTLTPWQDTLTPWNGIVVYQTIILHQVMSFKGGLKMRIEARSTSDQQSEFPVEGSLTKRVNQISQSAVKYDKPYYGVTNSRTSGIVVQREDGKSKLTLNSDVMDWQVDGSSALHYDAIANRLKFTGTLEGVDGKFSGTVEGGRFIGGEIQIGSSFSVNNAGHMRAVGAEFSGDISASVITGGAINGTTITGSLIQTSTAYPRAAMSSTDRMFSVWASASNSIHMKSYGFPAAGASLDFVDGSQNASISLGGSSGLYFYGSDGLTFEADNIRLSGYNAVYVIDWAQLKNAQTDVSMASELSLKANLSEAGYNLTFDSTSRNLKMYSKSGVLLAQVNIPK
ncbi:conserved hypothetical protein [Paenibacillus curdlanolyticus YK9]|uniref:Phage minor structural protein n=1 Tax=Paenibacillus curdlanolyticus YK9 TaxID=717606 RepID=E0IBU5_9BACL|nr:polymer-forming cytoskeletal protein [Paenibacillus curdlanolyticus]EFM10175.1 conserved hypothetical protein [Paenibacillus curdlanolyticus YK9]